MSSAATEHRICPECQAEVVVCEHLRAIPKEDAVDSDQAVIKEYLAVAAEHAERGNAYGRGLFVGKALVHAEQNAIDPDWLVKEFKRAGLEDDAPLVSLPKMPVGRG